MNFKIEILGIIVDKKVLTAMLPVKSPVNKSAFLEHVNVIILQKPLQKTHVMEEQNAITRFLFYKNLNQH